VPRVPHARFKGTSQAGVRGDAVHSFDWTVGRVLAALERLKLANNTLVILTSDNGGVLDANGPDTEHGGTPQTNNGHPHNGALRAGKGSPYEGGTRVPFLARWPGHCPRGVSAELLSHVDLLATFAALTGQSLPAAAGPDSFNVLPALLSAKPDSPCRDHLVEHGAVLAIRQGLWKLIPRNAAGAANAKGKPGKKGAGGNAELYHLADDLGETKNVAEAHSDRVKAMAELLQRVRDQGRSRP
jgi:arylsulfatase A-like enzyme